MAKVVKTYKAPDLTSFKKLEMEEVGEFVIYAENRIIDRQPCKLDHFSYKKQLFIIQEGNIFSDVFLHVEKADYPIKRIESPIGIITVIFKSLFT